METSSGKEIIPAVIVVDIGGTSTKVAVAANNAVVARTTLPSFKPTAQDYRTNLLCTNVHTWLTREVGVALNSELGIQAVMIGAAGIWGEAEYSKYHELFIHDWLTLFAYKPRVAVCSDPELVLYAANGLNPGIVLIAGTGSVAVQRTRGLLKKVGGWGPHLDDAGSGFHIGLLAMRAVAAAIDGRGSSTRLIEAVAELAGVPATDQARLSDILRSGTLRVALLAEKVFDYAQKGDAAAHEICNTAAAALALHLKPLTIEHDQVYVHGSLFKNTYYFTIVTNEVAKIYPQCKLTFVPSVIEAAALRLYGSTQEG